MPTYEHTQKSPLGLIFLVPAGVAAVVAIVCLAALPVRAAGLVAAILALAFGFGGLCFGQLTVRDGGDSLVVRFGPLPLFGTRVPYAAITGVEAASSNVLDGWGMHWIPGRGRIYNVWGFSCVKLMTGKGVVRIGTDDVQGLLGFLKTKVASGRKASGAQAG